MDKQKNYESYLKSTHRLGRIVSVITLVLLVGAPFAIGTLLGAGPDLGTPLEIDERKLSQDGRQVFGRIQRRGQSSLVEYRRRADII